MSKGKGVVRRKCGFRPLVQSPAHLFAVLLMIAAFLGVPAAASAEPSLGAMVDYNWLNGYGFPANTVLTLSVNGGAKGTLQVTTAADGSFERTSWWDADVPNQQLLPGDLLTANDGENIVSMEIQDVAGIVDRAGNRLLGTAKEPGGAPLSGKRVKAMVYLDYAAQPLLTVTGTTDVSGGFVVDLAPIDITLQHKVAFVVFSGTNVTADAMGPRTIREAYNAIPSLGAMAQQNWIDGNGFPRLMAITIKVNGGAKGTLETTTDSGGNFWLNWWDAGNENHLQMGDTITATFAGGTAEMVVQDVSAGLDLGADVVSGKARTPAGSALPWRRIRVGIYDPGDWSELASAETKLDAGGNFTFDLSSSHDLVRGEVVQLMLWQAPDGSASGHRTYFDVYNRIPKLKVKIGQEVELMDFPPQTSVGVSLDGGAKGTETVTTDTQGYAYIQWWQKGEENRPLAGDTVTAEYEGITVQMEVRDVQATADTKSDCIVGTALVAGGGALAGRTVAAWVFSPEDWSRELANATATVDAGGGFTLCFPSFDLMRGMDIDLMLLDFPDGSGAEHQTHLSVYNRIPFLGAMVEHRWIRGNNFPPDTDLTVALNGGAKGTASVKTDSWGNFHRDWRAFGDDGPRPKDTVTATYSTEVVQMVVQDIEATVDVANDTVSGMARDAFSGAPLDGDKVSVTISSAWGQQDPHAWLETTVDSGGSFTLDFGETWDIWRGNPIFLTYTSPEGHQTMREPSSIDITGTVRRDAADGPGMPGIRVNVLQEANTYDDIVVSTDDQGAYTIKGLSPGIYKLFFEATDYNRVNPATNYQSEWHDGKTDFHSADWVVVSPIGGVQVVDTVLENTGGGLHGTVTGDGGLGLAGIFVCVQSVSWIDLGPNCAYLMPTGADGAYSISGAAPGDYRVLFYAGDYNESNGTSYVNLWHPSLVQVTLGGDVQIDARLGTGGVVSGNVAGEDDRPIPGAEVSFFTEDGLWAGTAEPDNNGDYVLHLPPGSYKAAFNPDNEDQDTDYVKQWYRAPGETEAALVAVAAGETTEGIDARLAIGGRIQGRVLGSNGSSLAGVHVRVYTAGRGSQSVEAALTDYTGRYVFRGLAPGGHKLHFDPVFHNQGASTDYLAEWHQNKADFASATSVPVVAGSAATVKTWLAHAGDRLAVASPSAGAEWPQGSVQTIAWEGRVATGNVMIQLVKGTTASTVVASTPNDGSFDWTVPGNLAPGAAYKVRVVWLSNKTVVADSAAFTVAATDGPIVVGPSPASAAQGAVHTITWSGIPQTGSVKILLVKGTGASTIVASTPNDGSFDWVVPGAQAAGAYTVKVVWLSKPAVPCTGAAFTVAATDGPIVVGPSPASAAQGAVHTITWSGIPQTGSVKILLVKGTTATTVVTSTPNDGTFDWTVPGTQAVGAYTLRVVWLSKPAVPCTGAAFTVAATDGPIVVTPLLPSVAQGVWQTINWTGIPQTGSVKIMLYQGTILKTTVSASTSNDGSFEWLVPGTLAAGTYTLKVAWLSKPTVPDNGATFTVLPMAGPIMVGPPGASAAQGTVHAIEWGGIPQTGNVKILLVKGTAASTIVASTPNDGSFDWTVPGTQAAGAYTLKVVWLSKPAVPCTGGTFTVTATDGPVAVGPLPGTVAQGAVHTITWGGVPQTGNVKILLVKGTTASTIVASTPNDGSFDWVVPGMQAAGPYTVKVVWLSKPAVASPGAPLTVTETNGAFTVNSLEAPVRQGAARTISWSGGEAIPETGNVKILLVKGTAASTVVASTPNDGTFDWVVPGTQAAGSYTVKVIWLSKPAVAGESATFAVIGP